MGLDMFLNGNKYSGYKDKKTIDDFPVKQIVLELGYWRKHPNLHGYIIKQFAEDVDECQEIELSKEDMENIIHAIRNDDLPETTGFFFGKSPDKDSEYYEGRKKDDLDIFKKAIEWMENQSDDEFRYVTYRASW